jgi:hypothetical protein
MVDYIYLLKKYEQIIVFKMMQMRIASVSSTFATESLTKFSINVVVDNLIGTSLNNTTNYAYKCTYIYSTYRHIIKNLPLPPGIKSFTTRSAALSSTASSTFPKKLIVIFLYLMLFENIM